LKRLEESGGCKDHALLLQVICSMSMFDSDLQLIRDNYCHYQCSTFPTSVNTLTILVGNLLHHIVNMSNAQDLEDLRREVNNLIHGLERGDDNPGPMSNAQRTVQVKYLELKVQIAGLQQKKDEFEVQKEKMALDYERLKLEQERIEIGWHAEMEEKKKEWELRSELLKIAYEKLKLKREKLALRPREEEKSQSEQGDDGGIALHDWTLNLQTLIDKVDNLKDNVLEQKGRK